MERFSSPFGIIELTSERLSHIYRFHPEIRPLKKHFAETLSSPQTIRRSGHDRQVMIFYSPVPGKKYLAIVVKINRRNFILTAYVTNKIQHLPL